MGTVKKNRQWLTPGLSLRLKELIKGQGNLHQATQIVKQRYPKSTPSGFYKAVKNIGAMSDRIALICEALGEKLPSEELQMEWLDLLLRMYELSPEKAIALLADTEALVKGAEVQIKYPSFRHGKSSRQ